MWKPVFGGSDRERLKPACSAVDSLSEAEPETEQAGLSLSWSQPPKKHEFLHYKLETWNFSISK